MTRTKKNALAGIEYHGLPGISKESKDAVIRLVQCHESITAARILSHDARHCLLLTCGVGDLVAVKSGFSSGYLGEGSRAFSYILQLLKAHHVDVEEFSVAQDVIDRLDASALWCSDIAAIDAAHPIRPSRWYDYIFEDDADRSAEGEFWVEFKPVLPFAIIDPRIADLAMEFWERPDDHLMVGYRRLEDIVRGRTGLDEHGAKLFSQAFLGPASKLCWGGLDGGEQQGRGSLFAAIYNAYRNPRAHRELKHDLNSLLSEFLLLNHLYILEREAQERVDSEDSSAIGTAGTP
jgi:hypothetical protein